MNYRRLEYLTVCFIATAAILLVVLMNTIAPSEPAAVSVPIATVAPEVCESDGTIVSVTQTASLYAVTCSDGLVNLVRNSHGDSFVVDSSR